MLVICPECNEKNSEHSENCIKCGFPLKTFMRKNNITNTEKTLICPKCAYAFDSNFLPIIFKCKYCKTQLVQTETDMEELETYGYKSSDKEYDEKCVELAKKFGNNQFDENAFNERLAKRHKEVQEYLNKKTSIKQSTLNIPHCPTCNSTNVHPIPTGKRTMSILGFGILSKNVGKTYECLNCKMKW